MTPVVDRARGTGWCLTRPLQHWPRYGSSYREKAGRYGGLSRPTRLLVHYGRAFIYSTPWHGPGYGTLSDVVQSAAEVVASGKSRTYGPPFGNVLRHTLFTVNWALSG